MSSSLKKPGDKYRFKRDGGIALMRDLIQFAEWLGGKIGFEISADSFTFARETAGGGFSVGMAAGAVTGSGPLTVLSNGSVVPSTIGGVMPTIGGTALDAGTPPTLSLSGSGTEYVIATISGTVSKTTLSGRDFFHTMTGITVALSVTTTAINSGDSFKDASPFKLLLATFVDGVKTAQIGRGPISLTWDDDLTGAGNAQMVATWTA